MPENQDKSKPIGHGQGSAAALPDARRPLWARHPRVFLDVAHDGKASCPTAAPSTSSGELPKGHH